MEYTSKEVYEYISKKSNNQIVEWKKCRTSWKEFPVYQSDLDFYDKISPTFDVSENFAKEFLKKNNDVKENFEYKDWKLKAKLPSPTLCQEERERQRFAFRNEKALYKGTCSTTWKHLISIFSPNKPYTVYDYQTRWKWNWNPEEYALSESTKTYDALSHLILNVPMRNRFAMNNENSDYVNIVADSHDCYMSFASIGIENCLYVWESAYSTFCVDCFFAIKSHHCYDCLQINNCFNLHHSENCNNCSDCSYVYNCTNCHNCFNCTNLENRSYCIDNIQYTEEEYNKHPKKAPDDLTRSPVLWCRQQWCDKSFWNNLTNCNECCFISDTVDSINTKYTRYECWAKNCMDTFTSYNDVCIYMISCPDSYSCWCNFYGRSLKYSWYCCNCYNCSNCFACVWLRDKQYCIYNKQYTKEKYNQIVPEIIAQMIRDKQRWEFFDPQLSYFWYNETIAMEFYPLSKEEAIKRWYKREDFESPVPSVEKLVPWDNLPKQWCKTIQEKKPEILKKILKYAVICEVSQRPFRITRQEIDFYIKHNIPLPTKHPDIRHQERVERKESVTMHLIHCDECWEEMLSVHLPSQWKKILCEKCFNKKK
jgi:hypothetical protein